MPFTSAGGSRPPVVVAGDGNYVVTEEGSRLLDATAGGVACVILGHGRTEIADAVADQLRTLEYHCLFGYSHPRARELAEAVADRTPGDLNHVFFTNSGSEAVETALKMARGYWHRVGQGAKTGFVSLHRGYHGMNFGGISVGGLTENRAGFGPLLEGCTQVPAHDIDALEQELVFRDPSTIAAVVMEPVQAAGGVYPPPEDYLCQVRAMCDRHDVLLVLDEVVCGFGRLGPLVRRSPLWGGSRHHDRGQRADICLHPDGERLLPPTGFTKCSSTRRLDRADARLYLQRASRGLRRRAEGDRDHRAGGFG